MEYKPERLACFGCFHADARTGCCCLPCFTVRSVCCILILCAVGCVMAQVVGWQPFNWRQIRLNDRPFHVGFVADSGIGTGF